MISQINTQNIRIVRLFHQSIRSQKHLPRAKSTIKVAIQHQETIDFNWVPKKCWILWQSWQKKKVIKSIINKSTNL